MSRTSLGETNVTTSDIDEVVRRIVAAAQPEKIILFGSAARGEMGPHSDLDILVVKSDADHWGLSGRIRRALRGVNAAVDLVVATPEDIERYKDSHPWCTSPRCERDAWCMTQPDCFPPDDPREWMGMAASEKRAEFGVWGT